jgi:dihydrofolate reductase
MRKLILQMQTSVDGYVGRAVANDLVDEYQFYVNPVSLREGLSIFQERGIDSELKLRDGEAYASGIVVTRCAQGSLDRASAKSAG